MSRPRVQEFAVVGSIAALFAFLLIAAFQYSIAARVFPDLILGVGIVLCVIKIVTLARDERPDDAPAPDEERVGLPAIVLWLLLFVFMTFLGGILAGSVLFVMVYFYLSLRRSLLQSVFVGGALGLFVYYVFTVLLDVPLSNGLIGRLW